MLCSMYKHGEQAQLILILHQDGKKENLSDFEKGIDGTHLMAMRYVRTNRRAALPQVNVDAGRDQQEQSVHNYTEWDDIGGLQ